MDFNRNEDKWGTDGAGGVSYGQAMDIRRSIADYSTLFTLADLKDWGKIENGNADDAIILALGNAAARMCESFSSMNFVQRLETAVLDNRNGDAYLPYGPIGEVTAVSDEEGTALDADGYKVGGVEFKYMISPLTAGLTVTYEAGYGTCPPDLITAIKAQFLFLYENRGEGDQPMSPIAKMILEPLRRV